MAMNEKENNALRGMRPLKITILLATYNGEKHCIEQIDSILAQQGVDCTILISDDCSTDATLETIKNQYAGNSRVRIVSEGIKYGSSARNFFSLTKLLLTPEFSEFDFAAYCDQDDIWSEEKLSRAINCLRDNDADGYSSGFIAFWEDGRKKAINKAHPQAVLDHLFEAPGPGCTFVASRALFLAFANFLSNAIKADLDRVPYHDWFFYLYARENKYQWHIDPCTTNLLYRQHDSNVIGVNSGILAKTRRFATIFQGKFGEQVRNNLIALGGQEQLIAKLSDKSIKGRLINSFNSYKFRRSRTHCLLLALAFLSGHLL